MPTVASTNYVNNSAPSTADSSSRLPTKTLNQNDFLKLLVTQMSAQDPLNPKGDLDMAAQMAQFTSLEQSRTMSGQLGSMLGEQRVYQANGMLGRQVELKSDTGTVTGVVEGVNIVDGEPQIMVNGSAYGLGQVLSITTPPVIME